MTINTEYLTRNSDQIAVVSASSDTQNTSVVVTPGVAFTPLEVVELRAMIIRAKQFLEGLRQ